MLVHFHLNKKAQEERSREETGTRRGHGEDTAGPAAACCAICDSLLMSLGSKCKVSTLQRFEKPRWGLRKPSRFD